MLQGYVPEDLYKERMTPVGLSKVWESKRERMPGYRRRRCKTVITDPSCAWQKPGSSEGWAPTKQAKLKRHARVDDNFQTGSKSEGDDDSEAETGAF